MSDTKLRDQVARLSKSDTKKAHKLAGTIQDPWFKGQALAWVLRYSEGSSTKLSKEIAKVAGEGEDGYKQLAVRVWQVVALVERGDEKSSKKLIETLIDSSETVKPLASKIEYLMLLLHASLRLDIDQQVHVTSVLRTTCKNQSNWKCQKALKDMDQLLSGERQPKPFFW